ncbi:helix-turn-helix transcriptional regulator [Streptomyces albus subsp. chlorinus]|uniref:helix-turn-helix domain-containing protein n=1 Tax=Streptomyces albus TaxID=1888 RepID=UPI00156FC0E0|nr:helix-turn-helix transcriptional regulator [Streptomyces albus]NSC24544.1 helix-turn-helix transcriptional regulator [Streptomyces albus subsp. chlorinus]
MHYGTSRGQAGSSFDGTAARRLREGLRLSPEDVAYGIRAAYGMEADARTVAAWEAGVAAPDERLLAALAGALWCSPSDLMGSPGTLREYRMARGMSRADVALGIGMAPEAYARVEDTGVWTGDARQADALGEVLRLPVPALVEFTGRDEELARLLRKAATTRWQAYTGPVCALVPLSRQYVEEGLRALHAAYQSTTAASLGWGQPASASSRDAGRAFLEDVLAHFWQAVEG